MNGGNTPKHGEQSSQKDEREERQAEALRENLKRRKQQQRARTADSEKPGDT